ncbi:hypothetical protein ACT8ZV_17235 [Nocardioides sp. MAHUQ-72]|uniref:hypothetical protein n=1 Tax=unclassified Nocardioides TaxID=2615069 RepID=UPI003612D98B
MTSPRKILTLHPPLGDRATDALLTAVEAALLEVGATRIWVETDCYPDLTVMAMVPELHLARAEELVG